MEIQEFRNALLNAKSDEEKDDIIKPLLDSFPKYISFEKSSKSHDNINKEYISIYCDLQREGHMNYGKLKDKGYFQGHLAFSNQPEALAQYAKEDAEKIEPVVVNSEPKKHPFGLW